MKLKKLVLTIPLLITTAGLSSQGYADPADRHAAAEEKPANHHHQALEHHWSAPQSEQKRRNPVKADEASLKKGETLFHTHCSHCHGERGEGDGPSAVGLSTTPADLKAMASHHTDGDLAWKIAEGRGPMPGWKAQLTKAEIWSLVNYIKQLPKP